MITEAIIHILLATPSVTLLVGNRVEPNIIKQGIDYPAIYVTSNRMNKLNCTTDKGIRQGTIEVGVYADTAAQVSTVIEAVRKALDDYSGLVAGVGINIMRGQDTGDLFDDQAKKRVKVIEYEAIAQIYS